MTALKAPAGTIALAVRLSDAKRAEEEATKRRVEIETLLIAHLGFRKTEGQETYEAEETTGSCRLVLKQPINTKFDSDKWPALKPKLSKEARAAVRTVYELDTKVARALQTEDVPSWTLLSTIVERKPGKVQVSLERIMTLDHASGEAR